MIFTKTSAREAYLHLLREGLLEVGNDEVFESVPSLLNRAIKYLYFKNVVTLEEELQVVMRELMVIPKEEDRVEDPIFLIRDLFRRKLLDNPQCNPSNLLDSCIAEVMVKK